MELTRLLEASLEVRVGRRRWVLRPGDEAILGRDDSCQVVLVDSRISRRHASVAHQDGWHVRDLNSINGVYTGGSRRSVIAVPASASVRLGNPDDGPEVLFRLISAELPVPTRGLSPRAIVTIGRGTENAIVLDDLLASRAHARAILRGEGFDIYDLGSRNGTFVNGAAVTTAFLGPKDLLTIGHSRFSVVDRCLVEQVDNGDVSFVATDLTRTLTNGKRAGLGSATTAAAQTQAVLRIGGDTTTVVPSQVLRPRYTPFGQSNWSLTAQATFAASLPCMANTSQILDLMGQITSSQHWGMGTLANTVAFKGGWGPDTDGAYLVRQMAVVHLGDGTRIGLALAARPADGSFDTGISDLNALAGWVAANIRSGGTNRC